MLRVSDALVPKVCALCGTVDVARFDPTVLPYYFPLLVRSTTSNLF